MKTNSHQFDIMLTYMEKHGDISKAQFNARGRIRAKAIRQWEELTNMLNSRASAGEAKDIAKWKKIWADFKNNTRKKLSRIKEAEACSKTYMYRNFTNLERRVLILMGLEMERPLTVMRSHDEDSPGNKPRQYIRDPLKSSKFTYLYKHKYSKGPSGIELRELELHQLTDQLDTLKEENRIRDMSIITQVGLQNAAMRALELLEKIVDNRLKHY